MKLIPVVLLALALALPAVSAHAASDVPDRSAAIPSPSAATSQPFHSLAWSQGSDGGISLLGFGQLIHVPEAGGTPQVAMLRGRSFNTANPPRHLVATDDGSLIATFEPECRVESLAQDGQLRWRATSFSSSYCALGQPLVQGNTSIVAARKTGEQIVVTGLDRHGQQRWRTELAAPHLLRFSAPLLADDGVQVYVVAAHHRGNEQEGLEVVALDYEGDLRWRWSSPATESLRLSNLTARSDGGLEVAAFDDAHRLALFRLSAGGALAQRRTLAADGIRGMHVLPRPDGGGYILGSANPGGHPSILVGYLDTGATVWTQTLEQHCTGSPGFPAQCAWLASNGDALIFTSGQPGRLERYGRDGTRRYALAFVDPDHSQWPVFALSGPDDQLVVGVRNWRQEGGVAVLHDHLEWLDGAGNVIQQVQLPNEPYAPSGVPGSFVVESYGAVTLLIDPPDSAPIRRVRVDANGGVDFDVPLPDDTGYVVAAGRCGEQGVCIAGRTEGLSIRRYAGDDALPDWRLDRDATTQHNPTVILPLDDGNFDLIENIHRSGFPGSPPVPFVQHLTRITADGSVRGHRILDVSSPYSGMLLARALTGDYAMLSPTGVLRHVDADGIESIRAEGLPQEYRRPFQRIPGVITQSGAIAYVAHSTPENDAQHWPLLLVRVDVDGSTLEATLGEWPYATGDGIDDVPPSPGPTLTAPSILAIAQIGDDDVLVGIAQSITTTHGFRADLVRVGADGAVQWHRSWNSRGEHGFELGVDADDRILLSSRRADGGWVARALAADGTLLDHRQPRCAGGPCRIDHSALGADGTVLGIGRSGGEDQPPGHRVWQLRGMFELDAVALDAPGLVGTWFDSSSTGQGFTLRRYPNDSGSMLFMPWFTFSSRDSNSPEHLRWYTIQGMIEPGQDVATLSLLANTGGRFDSPPSTEPQPVGEVQLRFADCARGVLDYRFDPEHGGAEGSIALQRLLPPGLACGDVETAMHDPLLSASWYDPATSGQGLDLYRIPSGDGADGVLFGSWYTYVPDTPVGAANNQHWFTLQGIADSGDGGWTTTIVQTLGGRLDGQPTWNHFRVGEAVLHSVGCTRLQLQYRFDNSGEAGAFRNLDGAIELQRIGDCPASP